MAETSVDVELADFSVTPSVGTVGAGAVTFVAENAGETDHELVVLRTDLAADALPLDESVVDEDAAGVEEVLRIGAFGAGTSESGSVELSPGSYVLICNIPGHYQSGMTASFTVEDS